MVLDRSAMQSLYTCRCRLLKKKVSDRPGAAAALQHEWLVKCNSGTNHALRIRVHFIALSVLHMHLQRRRMHCAAVMYDLPRKVSAHDATYRLHRA